MLELKDIKKDYKIGGGGLVHALRGVSIRFRQSEFVSILGPSGCGKTTLLNIIGGLDHATSGELVVEGNGTHGYTDRDWDNYRNHRIGFVFQSYNLIPHQTVLKNVELALTIGGMKGKEREEKAKKALDAVGLSSEYDKLPNQLSGGQCQRVAIARALVSDPEILLADEPTGALDSETSVQIMDIIKEISKDRLVIMVTHNGDLAKKYSSRIIRLLDGEVVGDSNPYEEAYLTEKAKPLPEKKSRLSFGSAFALSAHNLRSKWKRTLMVAIAGSIGIIGVSTVLAISNGVQDYIENMEHDMISGSPLTVSQSGFDLEALMDLASSAQQAEALAGSVEEGYINIDSVAASLIGSSGGVNNFMIENVIDEDYVAYVNDMDEELYDEIIFDYDDL